MAVATSLLSRVKQDLFLDRILTGDEKWISNDNIIRKIQWLDKDQAPLPDPKSNIRREKILCVCVGLSWYNNSY